MRTQDRNDLNIEITEDAALGIQIRVHHNGRFPDPLAGFSKDVLRKARPFFWNSFERRVIHVARSMSWQNYRLVVRTLIAERALAIEQKLQIKEQVKNERLPVLTKWFKKRSALKTANAKAREHKKATINRLIAGLPVHRKQMTLGQIMMAETGLEPARPNPDPERERSLVQGR